MRLPRGVGKHHLLAKLDKIKKEMRILEDLIGTIEEEISTTPAPSKDVRQDFVAFFCDTWKERYQYHPKLSGQNIGALTNILKDFGVTRGKAMVTAFLMMNDPFFIKKRHDPITLQANSTAVGHFADSGKVVTNNDAKEMERAHKTRTLFDMVDQGKL